MQRILCPNAIQKNSASTDAVARCHLRRHATGPGARRDDCGAGHGQSSFAELKMALSPRVADPNVSFRRPSGPFALAPPELQNSSYFILRVKRPSPASDAIYRVRKSRRLRPKPTRRSRLSTAAKLWNVDRGTAQPAQMRSLRGAIDHHDNDLQRSFLPPTCTLSARRSKIAYATIPISPNRSSQSRLRR